MTGSAWVVCALLAAGEPESVGARSNALELRAGATLGVAVSTRRSFVAGEVGAKLAPQVEALWHLGDRLAVGAALPLTFHLSSQMTPIGRLDTFGFELLPTARAWYAVMPKLRVGAGVGVGFVRFVIPKYAGDGGDLYSDYVELAVSAGAEYALAERLSVVAEPLSLRFSPEGNITTSRRSAGAYEPGFVEWAGSLGLLYAF